MPPTAPGPQLLVSVRCASEARAALDGGADWIDVKEPARGPMGAPAIGAVRAVARALHGRRPLSVAGGELTRLAPRWLAGLAGVPGVGVLKLGLAGAAALDDWTDALGAAQRLLPARVRVVPVAYADHAAAGCPSVESVMNAALGAGLGWVVIDTFDKSRGSLFDHWPQRDADAALRSTTLRVVLAGRLDEHALRVAAALGPAVVGVRSLACDGGRGGVVSRPRVAAARRTILGSTVRAAVNHPGGAEAADAG
ncbi:hypothetical protein Pla175_10250 [Pirellulimonas nuda]|uniref:(5-formylfuran-3-yl)methyl phosphate synthase n=1 Tax=Pirellulimonas nuda TaxID=2528009 RepID=A0A518D846_9BACT|nr:(5-formylfuran-3-yl)methyl phosphate synthase [Pirellulimonas nuda]QDU87659.1 hypothetical protein Pla175_10250 [Pirellulimonas nuda]